jgi:hypothetical protein
MAVALTLRSPSAKTILLGDSGITGTFAGTNPLATMSASGVQTISGSFAGSAPLATIAVNGAVANNLGSFAGTTPLATTSATGSLKFSGSFASSTPKATTDATGSLEFNGSAAATTPKATMAASGAVANNLGSFAGTIPKATTSATGSLKFQGSFAGTIPLTTANGSGNIAQPVTGAFAGSIPVPTISATGSLKFSGSFAGTVPKVTTAASGGLKNIGSFAGTTPSPSTSASGVVKVVGQFIGTTPIATLSGSGTVVNYVTGTVDASVPLATMLATAQNIYTPYDHRLWRNTLTEVRNTMYAVKFTHGLPGYLRQYAGPNTYDVTTGISAKPYTDTYIRRVVCMPVSQLRDFIYDLTFLASNKNFAYGGTFTKNERVFIVDIKDLPYLSSTGTERIKITLEDKIIFRNQVYTLKNVELYEDEHMYIMVGDRINAVQEVTP